MLFNSYVFIFVFLPVTLAVFFLLGKSGRRGPALTWLFGASLFFYAWWNPADLPFLLLSIALNYSTALALRRVQRERSRHLLAACGVAADLLFLGYYKYSGFVAANLNALLGTSWPVPHRSLPLAISFFTFQQIVFLVDAYRGRRTRTGPLRYATGVAFFPHLLAGPIVQYSQLMPQFTRRRILRPQAMMIAAGVTVFTFGLFKKVILADSFAQFVPLPFIAVAAGYKLTLLEAWAGALSYTFQIYFDFSGYSDMAIGLALLFGITLPVNFRAISIVRSVLSLSTTMISSAQERDASAASMFAASLKVMTVAVTGTATSLSAIGRRAAPAGSPSSSRPTSRTRRAPGARCCARR